MKKIISLLLGVLVLGIMSVKADAGGPIVLNYDVIVTNKNGAACYNYNNGKYNKSGNTLAFGTVLNIYEEFSSNGYVAVWKDNCDYLKGSDLKTKKDTFSYKEDGVEKIEERKAVILAKGGLNLRKGPAVAYSRITTIPQYTIVTVKYRAGSYWFYTTYNGKSGWISGINNYIGMDSSDILISHKEIEIYDVKDTSKIVGTIPALTEVTDYIDVIIPSGDNAHYVSYNGVKGIIYYTPYKVNGTIKLLNDVKVYKGNNMVGDAKKGQVLDYVLETYEDGKTVFYVPGLKGGILKLRETDTVKDFEYVNEAKVLKKTKGYLGEGLFGEKRTKEEVVEEPQTIIEEPTNENPEPRNDGKNKFVMSQEMIIICVLGSIVLALLIIVIILLVNKKKNKQVNVKQEEIKPVEKKIEGEKSDQIEEKNENK